MELLQPDLNVAQIFLDLIAPGEYHTFQTADDNKERKHPNLIRIKHGHLKENDYELTQLNRYGAGIWVTPNATDGQGRKSENITSIRAYYIDLDGAPLTPVLTSPLPPHIIIETSPDRYHAYWRVNDAPLETFETIQKSLISRFNSDTAVYTIERTMRVPGFFHRKGVPFQTRMVTGQYMTNIPTQPYRYQEFLDAFEVDPTPPLKKMSVPKEVVTDKKKAVSPSNRELKGHQQQNVNDDVLVQILDALTFIPSDDYSTWLKIGMSLHSTGHPDARDIWDDWSSEISKYNPDDQEKTWNNFQYRVDGVGVGTIFHLAGKNGWTKRSLLPFIQPHYPMQAELGAAVASAKLFETVREYFDEAERVIRAREEQKKLISEGVDRSFATDMVLEKYKTPSLSYTPKLQIKGSPGLGKTTAILETVKEKYDFWKDRVIFYLVPTLSLSWELFRKCDGMDLEVEVIQGRNYENCAKYKSVKIAGDIGLNIMRTHCEIPANKYKGIICPYYEKFGCEYMFQFKCNEKGKIFILTHDWLTLPHHSLPKPDLVIIDENPTEKMIGDVSVKVSSIRDENLLNAIQAHIEQGTPLHKSMNDNGVTEVYSINRVNDLKVTLSYQTSSGIYPGMSSKQTLDTISSVKNDFRKTLLKIWEAIALEIPMNRKLNGVWISKNDKEEFFLNVGFRKKITIPNKVPILLIDADADLEINKQLISQDLQEREIRAKSNINVTQVHSTRMSNRRLLNDNKDGIDTRGKITRIIRKESLNGNVLVISNRSVRMKLTGKIKEDLCDKIGEVSYSHWGRIKGVDIWKDFNTIIIVGREQPPTEACEKKSRAIWSNAVEPLVTIEENEEIPEKYRGYRMTSGEEWGVPVQYHPDSRIQKVLELDREQSSIQAIERLRGIHSKIPKKVVILSNIPLDIDVDELVTLNELSNGGSKLEQIIEKEYGRDVIPLSPEWIQKHHQDVFGGVSLLAIKKTIQRDFKGTFTSLYNNNIQNVPLKIVYYRAEGSRGGHLKKCLTRHNLEETKIILEKLLGKPITKISEYVG